MEISYQDINRKTIDRWVDDGWEWGKPISREVYAAAKNGQWDVKLTPVKFVPHDWFGDLKDRRVLGLAAGGGQQMPIFAALGAKCTVLDYSEKQLESERMVAQRESYDITIVRADMTKRLPFDDNSFDLIFHPVSNCYVYAVLPIWRECARVLKPGGRLLAAKGCTCPPSFPVCVCGRKPKIRILTKKPIIATREEVEENPRSRSAKLRVAERV